MILINEQWYEGRDNMIVKGNFCMNSSCKNYWEDNCTKTLGNDDYNISIDENGKCMDYEYGVSDWYEEEIRGEIEMNKEERQEYIKHKIDRFKNINSQHQSTINEYCSDIRQMRRIMQENEELIEKLENEMLFGKE